MDVLDFTVLKKNIECDTRQIVGDNDYQASFMLDEEWDDKEVICRVVWNNTTSLDIKLEDLSCVIPAYIMKRGEVSIGVYVDGDEQLTTSPWKIGVVKSIREKEFETAVPHKAVWDGINEKVKDVVTHSEFDEQVGTKINAYLAKYQFDIFPTAEVIATLENDTRFETKGFYNVDDGAGCTYLCTKTWKANAMIIGGYYILPLTQTKGEIYLPYYGVRSGADYAESNSEIINTITTSNDYNFGSLLKLPVGHFYFNETIDLYAKQLSLMGSGNGNFTADINTWGATWIHFPNLVEDGVGINLGTGTISNFIVYGNAESYSCSLDRSVTYTAPESIVTEVVNVKAYGIKGGSVTKINNVSVMNFYYGMWLKTGNMYVTDVNFRSCHYGLSIGNDTKVKGVYGWNIMTLLQVRGAVSSVNQVRADSVGNHLVEITGGHDIYLSDLDADYCVNSLLHLGSTDWTSIKGLVVNGMHGRVCTCHSYDKTTDEVPTAILATTENYQEYGLITVGTKVTVQGMTITTGNIGAINPFDTTSNYLTPDILLCADINSNVRGINFILTDYSVENTKEWLKNHIGIISTNTDCASICINSSKGAIYYCKSGTVEEYAKQSTETLE